MDCRGVAETMGTGGREGGGEGVGSGGGDS
jgi:hypothetical protein